MADAPRMLLAAAAVPTAVTLVFEWVSGAPTSNVLRAFAGLPLGAALVLLIAGAGEAGAEGLASQT